MKEDQTSIESQIPQAMRARLQHFRDQANDLSFVGVRRLLEKDLGLDTYALDVHKKLVKQLLEKYLSDTADDDNDSKGAEQNKLENVKVEDDEQLKVEQVTEDVAKVENAPKVEVLSEKELSKSVKSETSGADVDKIPNEDMIKDALWNKATYFRSKSEELTMAGVRRYVEEELKLEKFSLDPFKKLISKQLDEILNSESEAPNKKGSSKSDFDSSEAQVKPKKKLVPKAKLQKTEVGPKKLKRPAQEADRTKKKKIKTSDESSDEKNVSQSDDESESRVKKSAKVKKSAQKADHTKKKKIKNSEETSADDESESHAKKSAKKEVVAPEYGKKVERLKSIIKACGMSVAPTIYKKAKQAPEDKREAFLIKELQELLSKEGLSSNPSEKDIKEVKRRKERAKELEGIDTSNIIVEGKRRNSTLSFVPPPKPKPPVDNDDDSEEEDDTDGEESSEDSANENDNFNENENEDNNEKENEDIDENVNDNEDENEKDEDDNVREEKDH